MSHIALAASAMCHLARVTPAVIEIPPGRNDRQFRKRVTPAMTSKSNTPDEIERQARRHAEFPLVSIQEVSKQRSISVRTLRRWQAAGLMPPRTKHGHRMKYHNDEIALMMAQRLRSKCSP